MRVIIIGSGNTATVLGRLIQKAGHDIIQVFSRDHLNASRLASLLGCSFTTDPTSISRSADIYIISISDSGLHAIDQWLQLDRKLVVHTAGSVSINILSRVSSNYGILYPLQSLRKEINRIPHIPFFIDGNTIENITIIEDFTHSISTNVAQADDSRRMKLHLAAVIVSNFTNYLYTLTDHFCRDENIDFKLLLPLMNEVIYRLEDVAPEKLQTGPAMRNDVSTIDKHLSLLDQYPELREWYRLFSERIAEKKL